MSERDQITNWLLQAGQRRPEFYETNPPRMSPEDMDLAQGMAYGTRHEPWVRGDHGNREHYARTFVDSQHIPSLAYGLDFGRAKIVDNPDLRLPDGTQIHGYYDPITDRATVAPEPTQSPGGTLSHEMIHRGHIKARNAWMDWDGRRQRPGPPSSDEPIDDYRRRLAGNLAEYQGRFADMISLGRTTHDVMAAEDERAGLNRTALTQDPPTDDGRRIANVLAEEIERLRRARGDFSRMGPR